MSSFDIQRAMLVLDKLVADFAFELKDGHVGGYFCVADYDGNPQALVPIGQGREKSEKYRTFALEKAKRLSQNPEHLSSWQSRDPDSGKYGGAIRLQVQLIFSFSGMPELVDEALMVMLAEHLEYLVSTQVLFISERSHNVYLLAGHHARLYRALS